ncbi:MAG: hypothetical protein LBT50_06455 [Prevotellaceae bacterium]|nr:hypothetical protein [Prevotellaceae bacterium]
MLFRSPAELIWIPLLVELFVYVGYSYPKQRFVCSGVSILNSFGVFGFRMYLSINLHVTKHVIRNFHSTSGAKTENDTSFIRNHL